MDALSHLFLLPPLAGSGSVPVVNAAPRLRLDKISAGIDLTASYNQGASALTLAPTATVTDADNAISQMTIVGRNFHDAAAETISFGSPLVAYPVNADKSAAVIAAGVTFATTYTAATKTWQINAANAPPTAWQSLLNTLQYHNAATTVTEGFRVLDITVSDGTLSSTTASLIVDCFPNYATLPTTITDRAFPTGWDGAAHFTPATAAEFTSALTTAAQSGTLQIIELKTGVNYQGNFTLPATVAGTKIVIRSDMYQYLPAPGTRIDEAHRAIMPTITGTAAQPYTLITQFNADNYWLKGLYITKTDSTAPGHLVRIGLNPTTSAFATVENDLPDRFIMEHCFLRGAPGSTETRVGVYADCTNFAFLDGLILDITSTGADTQCINAIQTRGPLLIDNSRLEASGENILWGGSQTSIPNLCVQNVKIRNCWFRKPLTWCQFHASYAGVDYVVKNLLEVKTVGNMDVECCIFENMWNDAQNASINFKCSGDSETNFARDIRFRHNLLLNTVVPIKLTGRQDIVNTNVMFMNRLGIWNNVFHGVSSSGGTTWGAAGSCFFVGINQGVNAYALLHNTFHADVQVNSFLTIDALGTYPQMTGVVKNNVASITEYGVKATSTTPGTASLDNFCAGSTFQNNVLALPAGAPAYPATTQIAASTAAIQFADAPNDDFTLSPASPYKNDATNGTDPGADVPLVLRLTAPAKPTPPTSLVGIAGLGVYSLTGTWAKTGGPASLFPAAIVTGNPTSIKLKVTGTIDGNSEKLKVGANTIALATSSSGSHNVGATLVAYAYDASSKELALTKSGGGQIPQADAQTLVRAIQYDHDLTVPTEGDRKFIVVPQDTNGFGYPALATYLVSQTGRRTLSFNFRATAGYTSDGSGEEFVDTAVYPKTRGNTVSGWQTTGAAHFDANAGVDRRLAGRANNNTVAGQYFRIACPPGNYAVRVASGDAASTNGFRITDATGNTLLERSGATSAGTWRDAAGNVYNATQWPGSNAESNITVPTTTPQEIHFRGPSSGTLQLRLSHITLRPIP